jgi:hypothetical protein
MNRFSLPTRSPILAGLTAFALLLSACNYPNSQPTADVLATSAAETVAALLTQPAAITLPPAVATDTPAPATETAPPPSETPPGPSPTVGSAGCTDKATFVSDVTIPDDTNIAPGDSFVKTWRLQNSGTCTWNTGYALVFQSGNNMSGPASVPFTGPVAPGSTVDLSANLTAPTSSGTYKGNWILRNDGGVIFGIGASANVAFWVQIVVGATPTATPGIHTAKHIQVEQTYMADLDEGSGDASSGSADFWFHAVSADEKYLEPQNGALMKLYGSSVPEKSDCKGASLSSNKIHFSVLSVGDWICYKTNEGRYGRFQVDAISSDASQVLSIDLRTWD